MNTVTIMVRGCRAAVTAAIGRVQAIVSLAQFMPLGRKGDPEYNIGTVMAVKTEHAVSGRICAERVTVSYITPGTLPQYWIREEIKSKLSGPGLRTDWHGCNAHI